MLLLRVSSAEATAVDEVPPAERITGYASLTRSIAAERRRLARKWRGAAPIGGWRQLERRLLSRVDRLTAAWLGTPWGLGRPQTKRPGAGKINCGMFVARILSDAGFNLNVRKFNRQAASDAIRSIAPAASIRYLRDVPMARFIAAVKAMGPGLFVIGLDYHIGFVRHSRRGMRFIHASYYESHVVDQPAASAIDITRSRVRVVGKILQPTMLSAWLAGRRIRVRGSR